jgi:hypothetical protein
LDKSDLSDVAKVFKPLETLMNVSATFFCARVDLSAAAVASLIFPL